MVRHLGGCHCGRVRFEVFAPEEADVSECNCSVCSKSGYLHMIVPASQFRLLSGGDVLTTYTFNTGTAKHLFCSVCGIKSFYVPRSHPDGFSVNARCIDSDTIKRLNVRQLNGREWEAQFPAGRGEYEQHDPRTALTMRDKRVADNWQRGSPYEGYVGRWSRRVAPLFLSWLNIPGGRRWLDVGCGTGALCAAIVDCCSPLSVAGVDPSEGFLETAREQLGSTVSFHQGSATALPLGDASVDVVVSGLVLNFVSDPRTALAEMARVTCSGGTIAAYVWDYAGKMELMRFFWDAVAALSPDAAKLDEGSRFPLCRPDALEKLFDEAGLEAVEAKPIDIATPFVNFDDYWQPFLGGQGPAPAYAMSLGETARAQLREHLRERLPTAADGSISLTARAWAVRAIVAK